jgi:flagellar biosynthesis anti-sigma factor FlgM
MNVHSNIENLTQILQSQAVTTTSAVKSTDNSQIESQATDQAQLSTTASQAALSATDSDVRLDKVASIQSELQAGTYSVPASAVAQKIIGAMLETDSAEPLHGQGECLGDGWL